MPDRLKQEDDYRRRKEAGIKSPPAPLLPDPSPPKEEEENEGIETDG